MNFRQLPAKILTLVSQPPVPAIFALAITVLLALGNFPRHKRELVQTGYGGRIDL